MQQQDLLEIRAAQRRFALSFPILFLLSLTAHLVAGGALPTSMGLLAGAAGTALISALVSRSSLTIFSVSAAALAAQFVVHLSIQFVGDLSALPTTGLHGAGHHGVGVVGSGGSLGAGFGGAGVGGTSDLHAGHSMFSVPMLAGHLVAAVLLAYVLVRLDAFLAYLGTIARLLIRVFSPARLIPARVGRLRSVGPLLSELQPCLGGLAKRGPPSFLSFVKFQSTTFSRRKVIHVQQVPCI